MARLSMPWLVRGVALALVLGPTALSARASFVTPFGSPPSLTYNQLLGDGFAAFNAPLTSTFDFTPATSPPDGKIVSQVYFNAGAGLYAYLYQVQVSPSAVIGVSNTVHDV